VTDLTSSVRYGFDTEVAKRMRTAEVYGYPRELFVGDEVRRATYRPRPKRGWLDGASHFPLGRRVRRTDR